MKKLKIGFVSKYFHPIKGGEENYALNLALQAVKDGHEVHVFTGDRKGKEKLKEKELTYEGIHIHRCPFVFDFTHYFFLNPSLLLKLMKYDLDVVHAAAFGMIWHDLVLIIKKIFSPKTKFINSPHGPFMALRDYSFPLKIIKSVFTSIQKIYLNWLYDIICQGNTFQWRWMTKEYGIEKSKIKYVSIGISQDVINEKVSDSAIAQFGKKYSLKDSFVISYLGRLSKYKGVQFIIEILPKLVQEFPNVKLLIMGRDDGYLRNLKVLGSKLRMSDYIQFIEDVSEEEKSVALSTSEIFIFPSQWEAFGIVMLEAMTKGNALVSTRTEGGKFLVTEGVNGFLFNYGDTKKLLEHVRKFIQDKKFLSKIQENNLKKVYQFSWDNIYEKQYKPILEKLFR